MDGRIKSKGVEPHCLEYVAFEGHRSVDLASASPLPEKYLIKSFLKHTKKFTVEFSRKPK